MISKTGVTRKSSLAIALLLFSAVNAFGAVAIENNYVFRYGTDFATLSTTNIAIGSGGGRLLVCGATYLTSNANPTAVVSTATFNGAALTLLDTQRTVSGSANGVAELWYLQNPASTSAPAVVTWSAAVSKGGIICHSFTGTNGFGPVVKGSNVSVVAASSQGGGIVVGFLWFSPPVDVLISRLFVSWYKRAFVYGAHGCASQLKMAGSSSEQLDWSSGAENSVSLDLVLPSGFAASSIVGVSINPSS